MPGLLRGFIVLVAGVVGLGALSTPAHADPYAASVSAGPGVLFADCTDHPINYSVAPPIDAITWSLELVFQAPDGTSAGSAYISKGDPTTGVELEQFCPSSELPGTYTVTGTYKVVERTGNVSFNTTTRAITPFTFDLRLAYSTVTAKASVKKPKVGQTVKVNVKMTDERPSGGYFGTIGATVQLQRQKGAKWVGVGGTKDYTNSGGKAQIRFKHAWKGKTRFRVVGSLSALGKATSPTFTLRGR